MVFLVDFVARGLGRGLAAGARDWVFERQAEDPLSAALPVPLDHLIDCLEHRRQPAATIQDARTSLIVALAAYQSARGTV
jgi:hypothetical protein